MADPVRRSPPSEAGQPLVRLRLRYPKARRLRRRRDFLRVQDRTEGTSSATRSRVTTPHFILLLAPRPAPGPCRLGVVTSKKVGCAVVRNRVKRLVREAFRTLPSLYPADVDLVVIAKQDQDPGALTFSMVSREIQSIASLLQRRSRDVLRAASAATEAAAAPRSPGAASPAAPCEASRK